MIQVSFKNDFISYFFIMKTVRSILDTQDIHGLGDMDVNEAYTVENEPYMDFSIEKVGDERLMAAHFYTQRGDLMSDPQVVFQVDQYDEEWLPVRYRQDGIPNVYQHDEEGLDADTRHFLRDWDERLLEQGFVEAAEIGQIE